MNIVAQIRSKVKTVFSSEKLEVLARETGFMKRKRKIDPQAFLEKMMVLCLECPNSSLEDLVYEFDKTDIVISKQALHKKFNHTTVQFMQKVLEALLEQGTPEQNRYLKGLPGVKNIQVIDSSEIRLHPALKETHPQVRQQGAALKLQAFVEIVRQQVLALDLRPSVEPDQSYTTHLPQIQPGDLLIADLGYFRVPSFQAIHAQGGFVLSRYFTRTKVYDEHTGKALDVRALLQRAHQDKQHQWECSITLGASGFPCRLVAIALTEKASTQRMKNRAEKRRKDPRVQDDPRDPLHQWTIFVTNLSPAVEADTLLRLYSARWQIELFFKALKTFFNLRKVDVPHSDRATCLLYVSLIAMVLLSLVTGTIGEPEISLYKASKIFIKNIREFFHRMHGTHCAISWLKALFCRFALKESRSKRPSTLCALGIRSA